MREKFYITTAIPYVNARPHIGHALEFTQTDVIARYHRGKGEEVLLLSGSDENALKNVQAAQAAGIEIQTFVDETAKIFQELLEKLNIEAGVFQKGSDKVHHYPASQKLWGLCQAAGDIYKKPYEGLYCVGCEAFYTKDELNQQGECFEHPGRKLDAVSEENYFFRLSKYQKNLISIIESDTLRIFPKTRKNEVLSFLKNPLEDISISRSNERAKNWGVPVPGDDTQRMYVWFDALHIYQSGVGFGWDEELYKKWWPADVHVIGKGIIRFHAIYWPAFLLSAKLPLPKSLFVHGYFTINGQKMSKTLGNIIDPFEVIGKYGADPVRYFFLREMPAGEDGDFSCRKLEERYNGDLANGLGNLVARVAALGEKISPVRVSHKSDILIDIEREITAASKSYDDSFSAIRLNDALGEVWRVIGFADRYISEAKPWAISDTEAFRVIIANAGYLVSKISNLLFPFLPETAGKIREQIAFKDNVLEIKKGGNLFPRLESENGHQAH